MIRMLAPALLFVIMRPLFCPAVMFYVDDSVPTSGDGTTWETAFTAMQEGIDAASHGDTVAVAEGIYLQNIQFYGKNIVLTSTDPADRSVVASTVIDGSGAGSVVTFLGTEDQSCVLSGFTVRNGRADVGGGIAAIGSALRSLATIKNNIVSGNWAQSGGAGIARCDGLIENNEIVGNELDPDGLGGAGLAWCDGTVRNNLIAQNLALVGGGLYGCSGTVEHNIITQNTASSGGGLSECHGLIRGNLIAFNSAGWGGGLQYCSATIQNNIIIRNQAARGGGLAHCFGLFLNNTVTYNVAGTCGGGYYDSRSVIHNCIVWANKAPIGPQFHIPYLPWTEPTYSLIQDWTGGGEGNIAEEPRFVNAENGDYRLRADSPCIDAGLNSPDLPETDITGMHRLMFGGKSFTVDIGAYEFFYTGLQKGPGQDEATLVWSFVPDKTYSIFYTDDLVNWHVAIDKFPSSGNQTTSWTDDGSLTGIPPLLAPRRFYRLLENP
ncbi:MAG: right-handed parallel beta-helix repeat-containing protein [bacterium]|nr:right-handed parallel beta-helix repeat-containing protein [bacterium]